MEVYVLNPEFVVGGAEMYIFAFLLLWMWKRDLLLPGVRW